MVQSCADWCSSVQLGHIGVVWCKLVHFGETRQLDNSTTRCSWFNLVQFGTDWCSLVQVSVDWCNLIQIGPVWFMLVEFGAVWCNLV